MNTSPPPGLAWLASRTGREVEDLLAAPGSTAVAALRELAALAARVESADAGERDAAAAELAALHEEIAAAPPPSEAFGARLAEVLREAARRLSGDDPS